MAATGIESDDGGDPPCWSHLVDNVQPELPFGVVVADLGLLDDGPPGAVWNLPKGGDLNANLVRLDPNGGIDSHINNEVDVLIYVQAGSGSVSVDGHTVALTPDRLALIPKGITRSITAGSSGIVYLSIHRQRGGLTVKSPSDR